MKYSICDTPLRKSNYVYFSCYDNIIPHLPFAVNRINTTRKQRFKNYIIQSEINVN